MDIWIKAKNFISFRRKEATGLDDAILASKRQLLEIFDGITDPILIVDRNFKILRLNRAMLSLLDGTNLPAACLPARQGKAGTYNDFIGRCCYDVLYEHKHACPDCQVAELFSSGQASSQTRLFEFVRDGNAKKYDVSIFPLKDNKNKIYAVVKYFKDVTYLAQLETELYDAERSKVLGAIALGLAHELRNPLAVISSVAQYLQKEHPENDIGNSMETIIRNAENANGVIADLLSFARPKERKIEVVNLDRVLEEGLRLLNNKLASQKIKVSKKFDKTMPKVWLDRPNFTQAFVNFVLHAIDSMPGGGELSVETRKEDGQAKILISDTGSGYPPEIIDRMFKPFSRSKGGPVDLRLPTAENIIKSYGGSVSLYNNKDVGATGLIQIPLVAGNVMGTSKNYPSAALPSKS